MVAWGWLYRCALLVGRNPILQQWLKSFAKLRVLWFKGSEKAFGLCSLAAGIKIICRRGGKKQPEATGSSDPREERCLFRRELAQPNASAAVMPPSDTGLLDFKVHGKLVKLMQVKTFSIRKKPKYDYFHKYFTFSSFLWIGKKKFFK